MAMKASNDYQKVVSLLSDFFLVDPEPRYGHYQQNARFKSRSRENLYHFVSYARCQTVPKLSKKHKPILSEGKKSLLGLMEFFDITSSQISLRRTNLKLMRRAVDANYFQRFCNSNAVFDGLILIGNRIAIPQYLQSALSRLHRSHHGQEALGDAAQNTW